MASPPVSLARLDHLVLTVRDLEATCAFYERTLGMTREEFGVAIVEGPIEKTGAEGQITSLYLRDPGGNLIEVSSYGGR